MNCKPGDLAIVMRNLPPDSNDAVGAHALRAMVGKVVHCRELANEIEWRIDPVRIDIGLPFDITVYAIGDMYLVPVGGVPLHDEQHDEVPA